MTFMFENPTEYNLHLVCEFYANQDPRDPNHEVKVHGKVVKFTAKDINNLLGVYEADVDQLRKLIITPNYAHIQHLLSGTRWVVM